MPVDDLSITISELMNDVKRNMKTGFFWSSAQSQKNKKALLTLPSDEKNFLAFCDVIWAQFREGPSGDSSTLSSTLKPFLADIFDLLVRREDFLQMDSYVKDPLFFYMLRDLDGNTFAYYLIKNSNVAAVASIKKIYQNFYGLIDNPLYSSLNEHGDTALHLALMFQQTECIALLVSDPNATWFVYNQNKQRPIDHVRAIVYQNEVINNTDVINAIFKNSEFFDNDAKSMRLFSTLFIIASTANRVDLCLSLIEKISTLTAGAQFILCKDNEFKTSPLHVATAIDALELLTLMLNKLDYLPFIKDKKGLTPIELAAELMVIFSDLNGARSTILHHLLDHASEHAVNTSWTDFSDVMLIALHCLRIDDDSCMDKLKKFLQQYLNRHVTEVEKILIADLSKGYFMASGELDTLAVLVDSIMNEKKSKVIMKVRQGLEDKLESMLDFQTQVARYIHSEGLKVINIIKLKNASHKVSNLANFLAEVRLLAAGSADILSRFYLLLCKYVGQAKSKMPETTFFSRSSNNYYRPDIHRLFMLLAHPENTISLEKSLIQGVQNWSLKGGMGRTLVWYWLQQSNVAMINALLALDVFACHVSDEIDSDGNTALHIAIQKGDIRIIQALLDKGANWFKKNKHKQTPLYFLENYMASENEQDCQLGQQVWRMIWAIPMNDEENSYAMALSSPHQRIAVAQLFYFSVKYRKQELVNDILFCLTQPRLQKQALKSIINYQNEGDGFKTALCCAVENGCHDLQTLLIEHGADDQIVINRLGIKALKSVETATREKNTQASVLSESEDSRLFSPVRKLSKEEEEQLEASQYDFGGL